MERGNDINDLIFGVLAQYGSVSLPSVGALRSVRVPASFTVDGTIDPPLRIVEFSNEIGDDKSLPELIAERHSVSQATATERYDHWLASVSVRITNGMRYTIEGVGTLNLFAEGSAIFSMDHGLRTLLNPYGSDDNMAIPRRKAGQKRRGKKLKKRAAHDKKRAGNSSAAAPHRYGITVAMAILTAVVCVLLISSVYFSPEGNRLLDRIDPEAVKGFLDGIVTKITEFFSSIRDTIGLN
ncbi:MAG: hypothetical protein OSJ22_05425 [Rikenellaceae bacterium]|nr:hypothetical protein [Rikenellaceae bacterium]